MKRCLALVVVVAAVLAALYFAFRTREGPIVLAYKFREGDESAYRMTASVKQSFEPHFGKPAQTATYTTNAVIQREVLTVDRDGSAAIKLSIPRNASSRNYVETRMFGEGAKLLVSRSGRVHRSEALADYFQETPLHLRALLSLGHCYLHLTGYTVILPERSVDVGQRWVTRVPYPVGGGDVRVSSALLSDHLKLGTRVVCKIASRYEGEIDLGEIHTKAAMRRMGYAEVSGRLTIKGEGTVYFSHREGRVIRHDDRVTLESTLTMGRTPGTGPSAAITSQTTTKADCRTVLVEKKPRRGN